MQGIVPAEDNMLDIPPNNQHVVESDDETEMGSESGQDDEMSMSDIESLKSYIVGNLRRTRNPHLIDNVEGYTSSEVIRRFVKTCTPTVMGGDELKYTVACK